MNKVVLIVILLLSTNVNYSQNSRRNRNTATDAAKEVVKEEVDPVVEKAVEATKPSVEKVKKVSTPEEIEVEALQTNVDSGNLKLQEEGVESPVIAVPSAPSPVVQMAPMVKNPFEIGLSLGMHTIIGDVSSKLGFNLDNSTIGLHIRKAFSYNYSLRAQYNYGQATMRNNIPSYSAIPNSVSTTNPEWYTASQTYSHTLSLDNVFTFGNNSIHKNKTGVEFNLFAGPTLVLYRTKLDIKDGSGNDYNWAAATAAFNASIGTDPINGLNKAKDAASKVLDGMLDEEYETLALNNRTKTKIFGMALTPGLSFGGGIALKLDQRFNLGLEQRFILALDDYLDGERWANFNSAITSYSQNNDIISNTTVSLNYNLAGKNKGSEPLYWKNKNEYIMQKLASNDNAKALLESAFADFDGDGVPNQLDQEEDSREGCPVDVKGIMLDSDNDGLLDCDDREPYSPAGYPVDQNGIAIVPPPACCQEMNKAPKVDEACQETVFPSVNFAKNRFGIDPSQEQNLDVIGQKMLKCPDMKLVVSGINDRNNPNGKYNEQLSYNRAKEVTNFLTAKYGISQDRFVLKYNQDGVGDINADRAVMFRNAQLGEYGSSNPPSPHPGLRAGQR